MTIQIGDEVRYLGNQWEVYSIEFPDSEDETLKLSRETTDGYYDYIAIHISQVVVHPKLGLVVKNRIF